MTSDVDHEPLHARHVARFWKRKEMLRVAERAAADELRAIEREAAAAKARAVKERERLVPTAASGEPAPRPRSSEATGEFDRMISSAAG